MGFASVTKNWVSLLIVSRVGRSSMSFDRLIFPFPTTDINDGKGVDIIEPNSTGMVEYLGKTVRLLRQGAMDSKSRSSSGMVTVEEAEG